MEPVRFGIVGCGVTSDAHLKAASESDVAEVVAVADIVEERARERAEQFSIPACYGNGDELLADDAVEAVILAMPTGARVPVAYKALEKGKHVLLEKPIACHASEVEKMIGLRGDRIAGCCSSRMSFTGHGAAARECVRSGALGRIRVVRFRAIIATPPEPRELPPPWRQSMAQNGGGILVNWSCYDLDYLMQILDWRLRPRSVFAQWWPVAEMMKAYVAPRSDADSHFIALVGCEDDITLSMERAEFASAKNDQAWEIIGTDATLHLPMRPQEGKPNAVILDKFLPGKGVVSETIWKKGDPAPQDTLLDDFARAVREGRPPRTSLEQSLVLQKITDAIYASARSGRSVDIV